MKTKPLHEHMRDARLLARLKLSDVAKRVGVSPSCISLWERGERLPRVTHMRVWIRCVPGARSGRTALRERKAR